MLTAFILFDFWNIQRNPRQPQSQSQTKSESESTLRSLGNRNGRWQRIIEVAEDAAGMENSCSNFPFKKTPQDKTGKCGKYVLEKCVKRGQNIKTCLKVW